MVVTLELGLRRRTRRPYQFQDDGCEISPHCLECPLPLCKFDHSAGETAEHTARNAEMARLFREGIPVADIAGQFGLARQTTRNAIAAVLGCAVCGAAVSAGRTFCADAGCQAAANRQRRRAAPQRVVVARVCRVCGGPLPPHKTRACSRACAYRRKAERERGTDFRPRPSRETCAVCGTRLAGRQRSLCGDPECRAESKRRYKAEWTERHTEVRQ